MTGCKFVFEVVVTFDGTSCVIVFKGPCGGSGEFIATNFGNCTAEFGKISEGFDRFNDGIGMTDDVAIFNFGFGNGDGDFRVLAGNLTTFIGRPGVEIDGDCTEFNGKEFVCVDFPIIFGVGSRMAPMGTVTFGEIADRTGMFVAGSRINGAGPLTMLGVGAKPLTMLGVGAKPLTMLGVGAKPLTMLGVGATLLIILDVLNTIGANPGRFEPCIGCIFN